MQAVRISPRDKTVRSIEDMDEADLVVKWRMTEMCNASCSYCLRKRYEAMTEEKVIAQNALLEAAAEKLNTLIESSRFSKVKFDLIGGEVSLLDLRRILAPLKSGRIWRFQVTTNLLRDAEYYVTLAEFLSGRGQELSVCASFHFEFQEKDRYFEKVLALKDRVANLTCEMVSVKENQDLCREFEARCREEGLYYMIEADLRKLKVEDRMQGLYTASHKRDCGNRYLVTFTDGTTKEYKTRNAFLTDGSIQQNILLKSFATRGFLCSMSMDYIYVEYDTVVGRTGDSCKCNSRIAIEDFEFLDKPRRCPIDACTLCGHLSLFADGNTDFYEEEGLAQDLPGPVLS